MEILKIHSMPDKKHSPDAAFSRLYCYQLLISVVLLLVRPARKLLRVPECVKNLLIWERAGKKGEAGEEMLKKLMQFDSVFMRSKF